MSMTKQSLGLSCLQTETVGQGFLRDASPKFFLLYSLGLCNRATAVSTNNLQRSCVNLISKTDLKVELYDQVCSQKDNYFWIIYVPFVSLVCHSARPLTPSFI